MYHQNHESFILANIYSNGFTQNVQIPFLVSCPERRYRGITVCFFTLRNMHVQFNRSLRHLIVRPESDTNIRRPTVLFITLNALLFAPISILLFMCSSTIANCINHTDVLKFVFAKSHAIALLHHNKTINHRILLCPIKRINTAL